MDKCRMMETIFRASKPEAQLARLINEVKEFAHVYVLARQRQKGCDGMGELAAVKEEFEDMIDKLMKYCLEQRHITDASPYDIDSLADEIQRI